MKMVNWIRGALRRRRALTAARGITQGVGGSWENVGPGHEKTLAVRERGYTVSLHVCADQGDVLLMVGVDLDIPKKKLSADLLTELLVANQGLDAGSYRLVDGRQGYSFALGQRCSTRLLPQAVLNAIAKNLVDEMTSMLRRLYALNLIPIGPEANLPLPKRS